MLDGADVLDGAGVVEGVVVAISEVLGDQAGIGVFPSPPAAGGLVYPGPTGTATVADGVGASRELARFISSL